MSLLVSAILPFALWLLFCLTLRADTYVMDQGYHKGSFFPLLVLYSVIGYAVFFASIVIALLEFHTGAIWTPTVLLVAAVYALTFVVVLVVFYESYLHYQSLFKESSNYARWKYAMTLALGLSALITFGMGLAMTSISAVANKLEL